LGKPANLMLTAGQIHDLACARDLIENADPEALIADKAYDADPLIDSLAERKITPVIPPKANRKTKGTSISRSTAGANSSSASLILSRRSSTGLGYHPPQLRTCPS
jgi:transposase